jgi:hypothetical protein
MLVGYCITLRQAPPSEEYETLLKELREYREPRGRKQELALSWMCPQAKETPSTESTETPAKTRADGASGGEIHPTDPAEPAEAEATGS